MKIELFKFSTLPSGLPKSERPKLKIYIAYKSGVSRYIAYAIFKIISESHFYEFGYDRAYIGGGDFWGEKLEACMNQCDIVLVIGQRGMLDYINKGIDDEFIKEILSSCQLDRRPNDSDRQLLTTWYNWGFSSDMIKEACRISSGKLRPLVYMNAILSDWKAQGIFTKENIPQSQNTATVCQKNNHFANERTYTKEELDALIDSVDDIKF
jgi:DnaD/phage-associated family protein